MVKSTKNLLMITLSSNPYLFFYQNLEPYYTFPQSWLIKYYKEIPFQLVLPQAPLSLVIYGGKKFANHLLCAHPTCQNILISLTLPSDITMMTNMVLKLIWIIIFSLKKSKTFFSSKVVDADKLSTFRSCSLSPSHSFTLIRQVTLHEAWDSYVSWE